MVRVAGLAADREAALAVVREAWSSGRAFEVMLQWVRRQGGRLDPGREDFGLEVAPLALEVAAPEAGWLAAVDCRQVGLSLADLGGARRRVDDPLDLAAGIDFLPAIGDELAKGQPVARIYSADAGKARACADRILTALTFSDEEVSGRSVILDRYE
jgi:thymidine phosphorylase